MSYYRFNRQELLQKEKDRHHNCGGKEKTAEFYNANKNVIKEKANNKYKNLSEEEKKAKREYGKNSYKNMKERKFFLKKTKYWFFGQYKNDSKHAKIW